MEKAFGDFANSSVQFTGQRITVFYDLFSFFSEAAKAATQGEGFAPRQQELFGAINFWGDRAGRDPALFSGASHSA